MLFAGHYLTDFECGYRRNRSFSAATGSRRPRAQASKTQLPAASTISLSSTVSPSEWEESLIAGPVKKKRRNPHKSGVTEPAEIHLSLNNFGKIFAIICGQTRHRFLDIFVRDNLLV